MRLFRATVALCALLPLTACAIVVPPLHSPTPTPLPDPVTTSKSAVPQEVAEEQHPQKDVTVGEFLNAGLYHPESNAFGTFRPCAEISAEQWQELGWNVEDRERVSHDDKPSRYGSLCSIKAIPGKNLGFASFSVNFEGYDKETGTDNARGDREDFSTLEVKKPKGFYVYAAENSALPGTCMAGVLTKRGRIAFRYTSPFIDQSRTGKTKVCQTAVDSLQRILDTPVFAPAPAPSPEAAAPAAAPPPQPSPAPASPPAPAPAPPSPTFTQVLGVGDYRPQDQVPPIFNACTQISAEQWRSLGWQVAKPDSTVTDEYFPRCILWDRDDKPLEGLLIEVTYKTLDEQLKERIPLDKVVVNKPDTYTLTDSTKPREWRCSVNVVTSLGRVTATYVQGDGDPQPRITKEQACQRAVDRLQAVFGLKYEPPVVTPKPTS
ncbi:MAG: DUF3558 family protein [Corynebacterium matruchotii]|uniref:DUF3558 family protein n=1 Tax=Corynebacterium matruchotii TaxID=43768 RepID=UPI002431072F|nr:DUF3558 family protein [Corynebacterium matruchotii]